MKSRLNHIVRINKRITTPVTLEMRPPNGASNLDVAPTRRKIYMTLKLIEPTVKFFTPGNATKYLLDMFPSEASKYTSMCIRCHKILQNLQSLHLLQNRTLSINFRFKVWQQFLYEKYIRYIEENNAFLRHEKSKSHKDHALGFFAEENSRVTLRETLRRRIQYQLMWFDLDAADSQDMIHQDFDSTGKTTGKERIIIPAFALYSHQVGNDNVNDRVSTFANEIRCAPENVYIIKNQFVKFHQRIFISTSFLTD